MANNDDFDMTFDGFDPGETYRRPSDLRDNKEPNKKDKPAPKSEEEPEPVKGKKKGTKKNQPDYSEQAEERELPTNGFVRFFTDERLRLFLGLTLLISVLFVLIAFISHFKYGYLDQSAVENFSPSELVRKGTEVKNAGGRFGAWLAQVFLCDSLGLGSLAFIVYFTLLGLALLGFKRCNFWSITFKTLLVAITTSLVLGLVFMGADSAFKWGGLHGYFVNLFLIEQASWIGAAVVSIVLIAAVVCVYLNEIHLAWQKWKEASNKRKLIDELKREREEKTKHLADPTEITQKEPKDTPEQKEEDTASVSIDIPAEKEISEGSRLIPVIENATDSESEGSELDKILNNDEEEKDSDFGFKIDTPATVVKDKEEEPQPKTDDKPAEKAIPFEITSNNDDSLAGPVDEPEQKDKGAEVDSEEFSIVAPEIEVAREFENGAETSDTTHKPDPYELLGPYDHRADLSHYTFPSIDLLEERETKVVIDMEEQQANKARIVKTLLDYKIPISKIEATVGPTVTLYEIVPAEGVRISQIKRLEDDIALSLAALGIRIIAPIPGKGTVGIEVPNNDPQTVSMRSVITSKKYQETKMALPMAMGATISNEIFIADLCKMPHLLVAGATGMGKSVGLNAIIASLLYKKHPSELKFVLVDPKMVEFSLYSKLERHFMAKLPSEDDSIITDPSKVIQTLTSLCIEMDDRYALLRKANVRSLEEYNKKFTERKLNPANGHKYLPYIVVIVDEFADLIMTAGKEVETPIARIAQKARAVGMHMIIATQRPSTNVITGIIKANFPGRIAFRVSQMVDSKTILDRTGANQLIGRGDMLFSHNGSMERVQCAFISTEEVEAIVDSIDAQVGYEHAYYLPEVPAAEGDGAAIAGAGGDRDPLFDEAARFVVQRQIGSTSSLQRQFNIGYNRAGRLMDQMEAAGIIGPVNGSKPRSILVDIITLESMLG